MNIDYIESNKIAPRKRCIFILLGKLNREIDFHIGKHSGFLRRINALQFYKCCGIRAKAILFDKKRNKNSIQQTNQIIAIYTVEHIIGEGKRYFSLDSMRLIKNAYFIYFFFSYHIMLYNRVMRAPIEFRRCSIF